MRNKKNKDKYEEFSGVLSCFLVGLVIMAASIALAFKSSKYGYKLGIQDYFNYASSLGGAILSAGISFFVLFVTIDKNKRDQEENMLNSSRPVIKAMISWGEYEKEYFIGNKIDRKNVKNAFTIEIKNIGNGPARNIVIKVSNFIARKSGNIVEKIDLGSGE